MTRNSRRRSSTDLALIAGFAALIAAASVIAIPIGAAPITLQTFAVLLAGAALGAGRGFLSVLLYLALGAIGLPVFAGGAAGLAPFAGPTIGYLVGMPLAAWFTGFLVARLPRRGAMLDTVLIFVAAFVSNALFVYSLGVLGLAWRADMTIGAAFIFNLSFVPLDAAKIALAAIVAAAVHRAFPDLLPRKRGGSVTQPADAASASTSTSNTADDAAAQTAAH
ncbi:biotin transporter BioY [Leucobacter sp. UT-8R-CII-1-4]|uniref:biotin transporter BioY n=1 Tax=Leucobacter sp. UT-8R-CII-1-4 TaxID=3040075 RepID=UPI0024A96A17|nr:biotin transporter BioY [Leucobacter sp. UT-8R-CII-1-4]MDI6022875.1 biotin transporter BioY [Leucobacter sp. UT-8R-CII-1-4]